MKMNMRSSVMLLALSLGAVASFGQCKLTWPEDPEVRAKAEEKVALYDDAKTQKKLSCCSCSTSVDAKHCSKVEY
jgi:hypothetical protein